MYVHSTSGGLQCMYIALVEGYNGAELLLTKIVASKHKGLLQFIG